MKEALKQVFNLVERFERNIEAYRSPAYNETQLRREFIDPFFEALGWDVANKAGYAEQYKDVVHEDAIKVAGATKAPDYCFRSGDRYSPFPCEYILRTSNHHPFSNNRRIPERSLRRILHIWWVSKREGSPVFGN
jgi:hypothetical protein